MKHNTIISTYAEKSFDEIQHHFMIRTFRKLELKGKFINMINGIY